MPSGGHPPLPGGPTVSSTVHAPKDPLSSNQPESKPETVEKVGLLITNVSLCLERVGERVPGRGPSSKLGIPTVPSRMEEQPPPQPTHPFPLPFPNTYAHEWHLNCHSPCPPVAGSESRRVDPLQLRRAAAPQRQGLRSFRDASRLGSAVGGRAGARGRSGCHQWRAARIEGSEQW